METIEAIRGVKLLMKLLMKLIKVKLSRKKPVLIM